MQNLPIKTRNSLKSLFFILFIVAGLFITSCSNFLQTNGNISLKISEDVLRSIAARAGEEVSDADSAEVNLEISLFNAETNSVIGTQSNKIALKVLIENPQDQSFSFKRINTGTIVYAKAVVSIQDNNETKELCNGQSEQITVESGDSALTISLKFNKKDLAYYLYEPVSLNLTLKNTNTAVDGLIPSVSLFSIDPSLASNDHTGVTKLQDPQTFISIMDDKTCFLGTYKGTLDSVKNINIKAEINQSKKFRLDNEICLLAVANYDDWENYDPATAQDQAKITSYIAVTSFMVSMENDVEVEVESAEIPCKISYYKYTINNDIVDLYLSEYISLASYNDNTFTRNEIESTYSSRISTICPGEDNSTLFVDFYNNYVTAKVYIGQTDFDENGNINLNPNVNILDITATNNGAYLNKCSINLKAVASKTGVDLSASNDVIWNAELLYSGYDINSYGIEYYRLQKDPVTNKTSIEIVNDLDVGGIYQLYVSATYQGITSSQMLNIEINNAKYLEFNVNADNFETLFGSEQYGPGITLRELSGETTIVLYGTLNAATAVDDFTDILKVIQYISNPIHLDMSGLSGVTQLPEGECFYSPYLISLILPGSFTKLTANAFYRNDATISLGSLTIPASVSTIEEGAFTGCSSLKELIIQGNNPGIIRDSKGCIYNSNGLEKTIVFAPYDYRDSLTSLDFATDFPGVTKVGAGVFQNCINLESVDFTGIKAIGDKAFNECSSLTTITNYQNVMSIGAEAFTSVYNGVLNTFTLYSENIAIATNGVGCQNLIINFDITAANVDSVRDNIMNNLKSFALSTITFNGKVELPDLTDTDKWTLTLEELSGNNGSMKIKTTQRHNKSLFYKTSSIINLIFNDESSPVIGDYQLFKQSNLQTITTNGGKISYIGAANFYGNTYLQSIDLSGATTIGAYAFNNSTKIATVDLQNATIIGEQAFFGCSSLSTITNLCANCEIKRHAFWNCTSLSKINSISEYTAAFTSIKSIGTYAFNGCKLIKYVDFSNNTNMTRIGDRAFNNCPGIKTINFAGSAIEVIEEAAFTSCTSLESISFENSNVKVVQDSAFSGDNSVSSISLGNKITQIGVTAFNGTSITSITIPNTVIAIGRNAFLPKTGTVSVTFEEPASGKTIKWYKLLWNNNGGHTQERNELWKSIFSSAKESFSDDDIAYYTTYLGEDYIQEESNTSTVITDISSSSGTDARYIRQFVGN